MIQSTQPLADTVIPPLACDRSSWAFERPERNLPRRKIDTEEIHTAAEIDAAIDADFNAGEDIRGLLVSRPRRIVHAAIRIGKSFEFVVECCVL
jgi:hypothetical protein